MANLPNLLPTVTPLTKDGIKQSFIQWLQSQNTFTSYNFTGDSINILLDLLAGFGAYMSYQISAASSEAYLDSAQIRDNLVSIVKELGYVPRSRYSARAIVNLTVIPGDVITAPPTITLPKNSKFSTSIGGNTFTFCSDQAYIANFNPILGNYVFSNITLIEGLPYTFNFVVDASLSTQRFIIPNSNVDTSTITVRVQNSENDTTVTTFSIPEDINLLTPTTPAYFIQEVENTQYEIYFGDGVLGQDVINGNIVIVDYLVSSAEESNFANSFTCSQTINGYGNITVETISAASGGTDRQDTESIRFEAPLAYEAQNRCVTESDYKTILKENYPNIGSLNVWGGQDNIPPVYGSIFISIKPSNGFILTDAQKQQITNTILNSKNVVTVQPIIIDPDYLYVKIQSKVKFNPQITTLTVDQISTIINNTIVDFSQLNLSKFDLSLYYSNLLEIIDKADPSIISNITTIQLEKRVTPVLGIQQSFSFDFSSDNALVPGSIKSNNFLSLPVGFTLGQGDFNFISDDGKGKINLNRVSGNSTLVVTANIGTVDYTNGLISINAVSPSSILDGSNEIKMTANPVNLDVVPVRNTIVTIDPADINIIMQTVVI